MSDDLHLALAPAETYRRLLAADARVGWTRALARPALVALVIGTAVSIAAASRVSLILVASTTLSWSFAVVLQMAVAAVVIISASPRRVGMAHAIDLWFAGHVPWSLWLLGAGLSVALLPSLAPATVAALGAGLVFAMAWTLVIAAAFCRTVLGTTAPGAWWRAAVHQVASAGLVLSYIAWSAGGWFRLVG